MIWKLLSWTTLASVLKHIYFDLHINLTKLFLWFLYISPSKNSQSTANSYMSRDVSLNPIKQASHQKCTKQDDNIWEWCLLLYTVTFCDRSITEVTSDSVLFGGGLPIQFILWGQKGKLGVTFYSFRNQLVFSCDKLDCCHINVAYNSSWSLSRNKKWLDRRPQMITNSYPFSF